MRVIGIIDQYHLGDNQNTKMVCEALAKESEPIFWDSSAVKADDLPADAIIYAAGEQHIELLRRFTAEGLKNVVFWGGHQLPEKDLSSFHRVILPSSLQAEADKRNLKAIYTAGVPVDFTLEKLKVIRQQPEYKELSKKTAGKDVVNIILPGDAPSEDGEVKLFTEDAAEILARRIGEKYKGAFFIINNGPRNCRYELEGSEDDCKEGDPYKLVRKKIAPEGRIKRDRFKDGEVHKEFPGGEFKVDPVSQAFYKALAAQVGADNIFFEPFKLVYGESGEVIGKVSYYDATMALAHDDQKSILLVGAESTTTMTIAAKLGLPAENLIFLGNPACNPSHTIVAEDITASYGLATYWDWGRDFPNVTITNDSSEKYRVKLGNVDDIAAQMCNSMLNILKALGGAAPEIKGIAI